jgi:ribosome-associated heat shock protein Hsp15
VAALETDQRLDKWLWCARFASQRTACAALVEQGLVRINRQPTDKPHARIRIGDVLTVPLNTRVRVVRVLQLSDKRGAADEARALYEELDPARR